jgi:hypothetical protein
MLIFGVLLVVMMLYRPQGFIPSKSRRLTFDDEESPPAERALSDDVPTRAGTQHYPGALHGPAGDAAHAGHPVLEARYEGHVKGAEAEAAAVVREPIKIEPIDIDPPRFPRFGALDNPFDPPASEGAPS